MSFWSWLLSTLLGSAIGIVLSLPLVWAINWNFARLTRRDAEQRAARAAARGDA